MYTHGWIFPRKIDHCCVIFVILRKFQFFLKFRHFQFFLGIFGFKQNTQKKNIHWWAQNWNVWSVWWQAGHPTAWAAQSCSTICANHHTIDGSSSWVALVVRHWSSRYADECSCEIVHLSLCVNLKLVHFSIIQSSHYLCSCFRYPRCPIPNVQYDLFRYGGMSYVLSSLYVI